MTIFNIYIKDSFLVCKFLLAWGLALIGVGSTYLVNLRMPAPNTCIGSSEADILRTLTHMMKEMAVSFYPRRLLETYLTSRDRWRLFGDCGKSGYYEARIVLIRPLGC